jgi:hypothetical protein
MDVSGNPPPPSAPPAPAGESIPQVQNKQEKLKKPKTAKQMEAFRKMQEKRNKQLEEKKKAKEEKERGKQEKSRLKQAKIARNIRVKELEKHATKKPQKLNFETNIKSDSENEIEEVPNILVPSERISLSEATEQILPENKSLRLNKPTYNIPQFDYNELYTEAFTEPYTETENEYVEIDEDELKQLEYPEYPPQLVRQNAFYNSDEYYEEAPKLENNNMRIHKYVDDEEDTNYLRHFQANKKTYTNKRYNVYNNYEYEEDERPNVFLEDVSYSRNRSNQQYQQYQPPNIFLD